MTPEASKALADRLDDYAAHADLADKGSEAVDLRDAAAALRSQLGTPFVCPKCGTRGMSDGKCSTIEEDKS